MKNIKYKFSVLFFIIFSFVNTQTIAIKAAKIYTAENGRIYENGILLIKNGKIAAVGKNIRIPNKATILDYSNYEIVPGFIDNHSHIGTPPENLNELQLYLALNTKFLIFYLLILLSGKKYIRVVLLL